MIMKYTCHIYIVLRNIQLNMICLPIQIVNYILTLHICINLYSRKMLTRNFTQTYLWKHKNLYMHVYIILLIVGDSTEALSFVSEFHNKPSQGDQNLN